MESELEIVVKYGGIIEDVIVEHPLYGEIKGILKIKNINDLNKFTGYFEKVEAKPLSALTNGIHLHTISADSEENMNLIKRASFFGFDLNLKNKENEKISFNSPSNSCLFL